MTRLWRTRLLRTGLVWLALVTALGVAGLRPNVIVITAVVAVAALTAWLTHDLADNAPSVDWRPSGEQAITTYGDDSRTRTLRRQLGDQDRFGADPRLHAHLVGLIDERLASTHRIDRSENPERAAALLGTDLTAFIDATALDAGLADPVRLGRIITRIESIGTETTP